MLFGLLGRVVPTGKLQKAPADGINRRVLGDIGNLVKVPAAEGQVKFIHPNLESASCKIFEVSFLYLTFFSSLIRKPQPPPNRPVTRSVKSHCSSFVCSIASEILKLPIYLPNYP